MRFIYRRFFIHKYTRLFKRRALEKIHVKPKIRTILIRTDRQLDIFLKQLLVNGFKTDFSNYR